MKTVNQPIEQKLFQKKRMILALSAILPGALLLHLTAQCVNAFYISIYLHHKLDITSFHGIILVRPESFSSLTLQQISILSILPFLTGILLNEISALLLRTKKEDVRTFILFFQLELSTCIMFGVFLFIFCFIFEVKLFADWYILATYFHGRYEYKLLTAFLSAAFTFSYSGMSLNRLRNYFSNNNTESIPKKYVKIKK